MASEVLPRIDRVAVGLGRGFLAGAAGTAAITLSALVEMRLRGRGASEVPQEVAAKLLRVRARDAAAARRLGAIAHAVNGVALGPVRSLLAAAGLREPAASGALFAVAWTPELVVVPLAGASDPPWRWGVGEVAISAVHHAAYTAATSLTWAALERSGP